MTPFCATLEASVVCRVGITMRHRAAEATRCGGVTNHTVVDNSPARPYAPCNEAIKSRLWAHLEVVGAQAQLDLLASIDVETKQARYSPSVIHEVLRRHFAQLANGKPGE